MERIARVHTDRDTLASAILDNAPSCFNGRRPPPSPYTQTPTETEFGRVLRLAMQAMKKRYSYKLTLTPSSTPSSTTISFGPFSPASINVQGAFVLTTSEHGTCSLSMTARIITESAGNMARSASSINDTPSGLTQISSKDAHLLLDDLLSLVAALFRIYERCDKIDEAVHEALVKRIRADESAPSEAEGALVDKSVRFEDRKWSRIKGTVMDPVE